MWSQDVSEIPIASSRTSDFEEPSGPRLRFQAGGQVSERSL